MQLRRTGAASAALVLALAVRPLVAQSRSTWLAGAGLSFPAGLFNAYANRGWDITAGWERQLGSRPVALRVDVSYARNADTTALGFHETTRLINVMANVVYHFQGAQPRLYALFGLGEFHRSFTSSDPGDPAVSDSRLAVQVGEGVMFRVASATVFVEGRFVTQLVSQPLEFFPVVIGIRFGGGRQ